MIAGLTEECCKFLTCRVAIIKEGMIRTWMDCVIAFSVVGITFDFIENMVYGMSSGLAGALARAFTPGHFILGAIMGYYYGKYRVTGFRKYLCLCFIVPVAFHTVTNAFLQSVSLGRTFLILGIVSAAIMFIAFIVAIVIVLIWQKNKKLDVTVIQS